MHDAVTRMLLSNFAFPDSCDRNVVACAVFERVFLPPDKKEKKKKRNKAEREERKSSIETHTYL